MGLLRRFGTLTGIRRRTLSSAWSLLRSGDLPGIVRRSARRVTSLRPVPRIDHRAWRQRHVDLSEDDRGWILDHPADTTFHVVVDPGAGSQATRASLDRQLHHGWSATPQPARWTIRLEAGVVLHEAALWALATAIDEADPEGPEPRVVYSDHDHIDADGRYDDPAFLPGWNPELFEGLGRIGSLVALHPEVDPASILELGADRIVHLPHLLASRPATNRTATPRHPHHSHVGRPRHRASRSSFRRGTRVGCWRPASGASGSGQPIPTLNWWSWTTRPPKPVPGGSSTAWPTTRMPWCSSIGDPSTSPP